MATVWWLESQPAPVDDGSPVRMFPRYGPSHGGGGHLVMLHISLSA